MPEALNARILLPGIVLAASVFAFDLMMPLGVAAGVPYVALVLIGLWAPGTRFILVLAGIGTTLTLLGYFFSPSGGMWWVVLTNRGLAIFAIWTTAILVAHRKRARDALKAAHDELEERVRRRTADLEASETRFMQFAESSSDWFWELDDELRFSYASERYYEITGFCPEDRIGKSRFEDIDPAELEADAEMWAAHQADLEARRPFRNFEYAMRVPVGGVAHFRISGKPVFDANGKFLGYRGTGSAITASKQVQTELLAAKEAAEHANRTKSEFLAHFSHELRTPLNAIIGFSEIMQQEIFGPLGDKRYAEYAGDIRGSGGHLLALISDILDLSRIEAGQFELEERVFDAGELVEDCARLLYGRAADKGVTIDLLSSEAGLWLEADERQLRQILLNLLSNAVKFTRPNTIVTMESEIDDHGEMCFRISDCGEGMSADDIERVQEPFIRLKGAQTSSEEGTGLGLAITKRLLESHGGGLRMCSETGVGTTATACFPRERVIGENPAALAASAAIATPPR